MMFLILSFSQISCLDKLGAKFPPLNTRKLKKKVQPTYEFSKVVMEYKAKNGFWPKSEQDLMANNKNAVNSLYDRGFKEWHLGTDSQDSLNIHFVHDPVSEGSHIGGVPIPTKKVKIKTLYIFSSGLIKTKFDKK
ncbi:hypothetical protein [Dyadobacter sp. CY312]|uniref:hypothetical protein n=1 Tax=Dyadobacter sp. CY312 TaxID=2907303 RepID=UPI001F15AC51|nr:hypothetical protein [Dyadobacter sp. CY312]MCE7041880.1 hypothetical protein [Dyadobacter sp. CY312]